MTGSDLDAFFALAERLADATGPIARTYFRGRFSVDDKADSSPVTQADREMEAVMRELIEDTFPDHGIFGEEYGKTRMDAEWVWVLDPIDGTQGFVTGKPLFGTLIALTRGGRPVLGVIDAPATGERWVGGEGRPTTFCGNRVTVRDCDDLGKAWLYTTSPYLFPDGDDAAFERLRLKAKKTNFGTDCYAYGMVAGGWADVVAESGLKPYDYLALAPVVEGAGGIITDWSGQPLDLESDGRVLASGDRRVHRAALTALEGGG